MWLKILFPLFFMAGLGILPLAKQVFDLSQAVRTAEQDGQHGLAALKLYALAGEQPWRADLWQQAGSQQYAVGDFEAAIRDLERAANAGTLSVAQRSTLASAYEQTGQYTRAAETWTQVVNAAPDAVAYSHLVSAWRKAGSAAGVIAALRGWQAVEPFNPQVAYTLGIFLAAGQQDEALSQFNEAARLAPADYAHALDTMQRAIALSALNEDDGYRYTVIGRGLASLGEWDLAEQAFESATNANPGYAEAWAFWGEARLQLGEDGEKELETALRINPNSVLVRALMALALGRAQQWDAAIEQLQVAARLEPQRGAWRLELGNLYAQKGDLVAARGEYQKAIDLEPNNAQTWYALAAFCYQYGVDLEQSGQAAARKALAIDVQDARSNDLLGAILVELGKEDEGERYLLKAADLNPGLAEAHLHLGNLYLQRQQMADAYKQLVWTVRVDPHGSSGELAQRLLVRYFDAAESTPQP